MLPPAARARGRPGPPRREGGLYRRSGSRPPRSARSTTAPTSTARSPRSGSRRCSRPGAAATTARARRCCATAADVDAAWAQLGGVPLILEAFVPFTRELSIIAVRGARRRDRAAGRSSRTSTATASCASRARRRRGSTPRSRRAAEACIVPLLDALDYVGVRCVELFDVDGALLANEIAPRVHNSGHWTIEGAETSQFENHLRAVLGWPLGSTAARGPRAMVNCIGAMPDRDAVLAVPGAHLTTTARHRAPGRKLGHVTIVAPDADDAAKPASPRVTCVGRPDASARLRRSRRSRAAWRSRRRRSPSRRAPRRCAGRATARTARTSATVREKRGAGAGCGTPSRSMIVLRALMCASFVASDIVSTGAKHASLPAQDLVPLVARLGLEQLGELGRAACPSRCGPSAAAGPSSSSPSFCDELGVELRLERTERHELAVGGLVGVVEGRAGVEHVLAERLVPEPDLA